MEENERTLRDQKEGNSSNTWAKGQRASLDDSASLISSLVPKVKLKPKLSTWEGGFAGVMMESLIKKMLFIKMRAGLKAINKTWQITMGPFPHL